MSRDLLNLGLEVRDRGPQRFKSQEGWEVKDILHCWLWRSGGVTGRECRWSLGAERWERNGDLNELRGGFPPRTFRKEFSLADTMRP